LITPYTRRAGRVPRAPRLLGAVPELDSIVVINHFTTLEEYFGITVTDDEIGAHSFESLDSLKQFTERKLT
jgi:acyl carrier protein